MTLFLPFFTARLDSSSDDDSEEDGNNQSGGEDVGLKKDNIDFQNAEHAQKVIADIMAKRQARAAAEEADEAAKVGEGEQ